MRYRNRIGAILGSLAALTSASVHILVLSGVEGVFIRALGKILLGSFLIAAFLLVFSRGNAIDVEVLYRSRSRRVALGALLTVAIGWGIAYALVTVAAVHGGTVGSSQFYGGSKWVGLLWSSSVCTWGFATIGAVLWAKRG